MSNQDSYIIAISGLISRPGIFRNRNKHVASEKAARCAQRSVPRRNSRYARTEAATVSDFETKPSLSFFNAVEIMSIDTYILPKLMGTPYLDKVDILVYTNAEVIILETAKLFTSGGSQAVRLPKSCRFPGDEVAVKKVGDIVMLYRADKALENFLRCEPLTDDVYGSILEARHEDEEYAANHADDRKPML